MPHVKSAGSLAGFTAFVNGLNGALSALNGLSKGIITLALLVSHACVGTVSGSRSRSQTLDQFKNAPSSVRYAVQVLDLNSKQVVSDAEVSLQFSSEDKMFLGRTDSFGVCEFSLDPSLAGRTGVLEVRMPGYDPFRDSQARIPATDSERRLPIMRVGTASGPSVPGGPPTG